MSSSTNVDNQKCEIAQLSSYANVNFSANVDSVHNTMCYPRRCDSFTEPVLELQGIKLAHCYVKSFNAYHAVVSKQTPLFLEYGLKQESQFRLQQKLGPHLSSPVSFEAVDKSLILGDGRQLLLPDVKFPLEYRNGLIPAVG